MQRQSTLSELRNCGWLAVAMLVAAYAVSFLDRQIVALLVEPMKHDLGLSDTQVGLLQGPAFGIFYALLSIPLGWLADRVDRVRLIAAAIFLWSAMTSLCGLANTFGGVFAGRIGVGIGEAALVPAAVSLLADRFGPRRRALPLSLFTAGVTVGGGLSLALGGTFIGYSQHGLRRIPGLGTWLAGLHPWQSVFLLIGACGLPLSIAVLILQDPRSSPPRQHSWLSKHRPSRSDGLWAHVSSNRELLAPFLLAIACLYILANAVSAWFPTLFVRQFGWSAQTVGRTIGLLIVTVAVTGNFASGVLTQFFGRDGALDAPARTMLLGGVTLLPLALLLFTLTSADAATVVVIGIYFAVALTFGVATTAFSAIAPPALRGRVVALYLLVGNLAGLGLGPVSVGLLLDHTGEQPNRIGSAIGWVSVTAVIPAILLLWRVRRRFASGAQKCLGVEAAAGGEATAAIQR